MMTLAALATAVVIAVGACSSTATPAPTTAQTAAPSVAATAAPSTGGASVAGKKMTFITFGNASEYQIAQGEWFKQFAEAEGASVNVIDGKFDPTVQAKAMDDAIAAGVDAIAIQPFDTVAVAPQVKAARDAGIVVGIVGSLPDPSAVVPAIGTFNDEELVRESARDAVAWLKANKPGEKAKLVIFDIAGVIICHDWRMVPFVDEVKKQMGAENVVEVYNDTTTHTLDWITKKMEDLIQSGQDFNMFTACGGTGAVGGLNALTAAGMAKAVNGVPQDIWTLSIDATPDELKYLVDPNVSLANTIALTPKTNAQVFLDNMKKIFAGEIDPDSNFVGLAPGILFRKADGCQKISDTLKDQYAVVPGYQALSCQ
jgi:ABC-type sugar transport system substrate-binding protein